MTEERPGDVAGDEQKGAEREEEERDGDEGNILGQMQAVGRASVEHAVRWDVLVLQHTCELLAAEIL